jgi:hypothetical protein
VQATQGWIGDIVNPISIIPEYQAVPLPGPHWLLKTLLIVGFYLHAIPMNVALMGGLVSALFLLIGRKKNHLFSMRLGNSLAFSLPFFVSVAITMGVVPLLFLQLVYGPLFYTSSVLMAVPWLSVIFLLLAAYGAYYSFTYRRHILMARGPGILLLAALLFMTIAFFFTNNMTLMLVPEQWAAIYQASPYGTSLNLQAPQLVPRYLHFVVAAVAVTSLVIGCFGLYWHRREQKYGQWLIRTAAGLFLGTTLLQFPIGIWFMLSLPYPIMMNFLGNDPAGTAIFMASMTGDIVALAAMFMASKSGSPRPFRFGMISALIVVLLMVIVRHLVRVYFTEPVFRPEAFPASPQWLLIILFVIGAVLLILYTVWLIRLTWRAFHPSDISGIRAESA